MKVIGESRLAVVYYGNLSVPYSNAEEKNQRNLTNYRNILSRMENSLGPLQVLHNCMETKLRIKVFTRSARGIRGFIEAYVAAFDKHWNLALEDCTETWTRKIKRKAPALGLPIKLDDIIEEEDVPKVIVKETNGKTETLMRHVSQMLLRGEQIAIIVVIH
ncbi:hypothetical protein PV327_005460 [Microctonus hyperodae]|uniref:Sm domain-containing protein n=1 Tax=Microctonus hyperodae TaxID=165561 RepID=A0AA39G1E2_MICHY|nr:hypothetical protein PV327_005460 [Microctonus hyperodae]